MLKNKPFALYLDQLRCHKSNVIKALYAELDILPIYNVSYSPELNPIESVFSQIKLKFRQQRLNKLANEEEFNVDDEIEAACNVVTPQLV
jgi:transposase|tara:strand:- start:204 stop:473 length:270 start_codon:yes stop_codon:yes gene_type:complete